MWDINLLEVLLNYHIQYCGLTLFGHLSHTYKCLKCLKAARSFLFIAHCFWISWLIMTYYLANWLTINIFLKPQTNTILTVIYTRFSFQTEFIFAWIYHFMILKKIVNYLVIFVFQVSKYATIYNISYTNN